MLVRRVLTGVLAPLAITASALTATTATAWASPPQHPKPHPPAVSAGQCTAGHGHIMQTKNKKGTLKMRCQGGSLNGRTVKP
jgi:hypothetical protein